MRIFLVAAAASVLFGTAQAGSITSDIEVAGDYPGHEVYGTGTVTFDDTPTSFLAYCGCDLQGYLISTITFEIDGETFSGGGGQAYDPYSLYLGVDGSFVLAITGNYDLDGSWEFWDYFANDGFYISYYRLLGVTETPLPAAAWIFLAGLVGIGQRLRSIPTIK